MKNHSREALISTDPIPTYSSTNQVHNAPSMQTLSKGEQNSSCLQSGLRAQQRVEADIPSLYQAQTELMQWKTQFRGENGSDLVNAFYGIGRPDFQAWEHFQGWVNKSLAYGSLPGWANKCMLYTIYCTIIYCTIFVNILLEVQLWMPFRISVTLSCFQLTFNSCDYMGMEKFLIST